MTELQKTTRLNNMILAGTASHSEIRNYLIKRYSYNATNRMIARINNGSSLNDAIYSESKYSIKY